jgi:alkylation response protein AidB-like acyl-CoA dehydrogenase
MVSTDTRPASELNEDMTIRDDLVSTAQRLGPLCRQHARDGERDRQLPRATAAALQDAGLFRLCRPRRLGGLEADPLTVIDVIEELARHDASSAWCALNSGIAGLLQTFLPAEANRVIGAVDTVVNGVVAPSGHAVESGDGYRVSGRWTYVSNCHQCNWLALTCVVDSGEATGTSPGPALMMAWIPASEWRILDTWDTAGLRATGSHDVEVDGVVVPRERTVAVPFPDPADGGALSRFPIVGLFSVAIAAAALGTARASIDELLRLADAKTPFGMASPLSTRPMAQIALCEALATSRSARALLVQETSNVWELAGTGTPIPANQQGLLRIAATHATAAAARTVDSMYSAAGGSAIHASSPLQQCLRDVRAITQHFFVAAPTYEMVGKILLGVETDGFML